MVRRLTMMLFVLAQCVFSFGPTPIITLVFPSGARSYGMGEVGTALADDEDVLFYNPAGLSMRNDRWHGGAVTNFYEHLLPVFNIPGLWHYGVEGIYQPQFWNWCGIGISYNLINFGINEWTNDLGLEIGRARSSESVTGIYWGFNLEGIGLKNHYFGVSTKYVYSALAPSYGPGNEGTGQIIAFDIGYIWKFLPSMRFGLNLQNMGPNIFYISQQEEDPIPFTLNMALAYSRDFVADNGITVSQVRAEIRTNRVIEKNYVDQPPDLFYTAIYTGFIHDTSSTFKEQLGAFNVHLGAEYTLFNTFSIRSGFLYDDAGLRVENHWGFGIELFNHFQLDQYWIYSPEGYLGWLFHNGGSNGARDGQWGINFTFFNIFKWTAADHTWWKN